MFGDAHLPSDHAVNHGPQTFLWQRARPVIVGWFAGPTWKNNKIVLNCLNYCVIFSIYT